MVVGGSGLYGRTDQVSEALQVGPEMGLLYVATKYCHLLWIPLIPLRSYAVISRPGAMESIGLALGFEGPLAAVPIPLSFKSILLGHLRAIFVWGMVLSFAACGVMFGTSISPGADRLLTDFGLVLFADIFGSHFPTALGMGLGAAFLLWLSYFIGRASQRRQTQLLQFHGLEVDYPDSNASPTDRQPLSAQRDEGRSPEHVSGDLRGNLQAGSMVCPVCGIVNVTGSSRCECGFRLILEGEIQPTREPPFEEASPYKARSLQEYQCKPDSTGIVIGFICAIFFGGGGVLVLIVGDPDEGSATRHWLMMTLCISMGVGGGLMAYFELTARQRIAFGESRLMIPRSRWSSREVEVPYSHIMQLSIEKHGERRNLRIDYLDGGYTLMDAKLPKKEDLDAIFHELSRRTGIAPHRVTR